MLIQKAFEQFITECQNGRITRRSEVTVLNYQNTFNQLLKWFSIEECSQLTEDLLWRFFNRGEVTRKWKPSTVISHRKNISPFISWCVSRGFIEKNFLDDIPKPRLIKNPPDFYSDEEIDKILHGVNVTFKNKFTRVRNLSMIGVLLLSGLRKGELLRLKMSDIDFENNVIRVRAENAKNRRARPISLSFRLKELLEAYIKLREEVGVESYFLWVSSNNQRPLTEHGYKHMLKELSESVGFTVKSHKCRHTFATNLYKGGRDIIAVKEALGHQDIATVMIYTYALPELTQVAVEKNPLNCLF